MNHCKECQKEIPNNNKYCSNICQHKFQRNLKIEELNKRDFFSCSTCKEEVDLFIGVDIKNKIIVKIPFEKSNKTEMHIRKVFLEGKNYKMNFLKDFII